MLFINRRRWRTYWLYLIYNPFLFVGSCWAIAVVEVMETTNQIWWGVDINLPPLSVQQVLDCVPDNRCKGGSELNAYAYVIKKWWLAREQDYPCTAINGTCDYSRADHIVRCDIEGFVLMQPPSELTLKTTIYEYRLVTDIISSNSSDFRDYKCGIFIASHGEKIDHTVLVVGYGNDEDKPYVRLYQVASGWVR